jgi:hypothetical protein
VPIARHALVAPAGLDVQIAPLVVNYTGQVGDRAQDRQSCIHIAGDERRPVAQFGQPRR